MEKSRNTDIQALKDIINDCDMIFRHMERLGVTRESMLTDYTCLDAVLKRIENIGEIVYERMSEEFLENHTEIDWHVISGMRHRLVHHYQNAKWDIVVDVAYDEIPRLKNFCKKTLNEFERKI